MNDEENFVSELSSAINSYVSHIQTQQSRTDPSARMRGLFGGNQDSLVPIFTKFKEVVDKYYQEDSTIVDVVEQVFSVFKKIKKGDKVLAKSVDNFLDNVAAAFSTYEGKQRDRISTLKEKEDELGEKKKTVSDQEADILSKEEELRVLTEEKDGLGNELLASQEIAERLSQDLEKLKYNNHQLEKCGQGLQHEVDSLKKDLKLLEEKNNLREKELRAQITQLEKELERREGGAELQMEAIVDKSLAQKKLAMLNEFMIPFEFRDLFPIEGMTKSLFREVLMHYRQVIKPLSVPEFQAKQQTALTLKDNVEVLSSIAATPAAYFGKSKKRTFDAAEGEAAGVVDSNSKAQSRRRLDLSGTAAANEKINASSIEELPTDDLNPTSSMVL